MGAQRQLWIALALSLCAAVLLRGAGAQSPTLNVDRNGNTNTITLECLDSLNNPVMDNTVEYRYRSPTTTPLGSDPVPVTLNGDARRSVEFVLTPQTEGEYFCTVNDVSSAIEELVAFPEQVPMVTALAIQRGDTLTLDCDFEVGLLDSHYDFTWFRINSISGFREQLLNGADRFRVFTSGQINSLEIMAVEIEDESDQYYCMVTITHPSLGGNPVPADGRDIRVDVFDPVHVETAPNSKVVLEDNMETVQFQCEFDGYPAPSIKWKLNGIEVQNGSDSGRFLVSTISRQVDSITRVTSNIDITSTKAQDNGLVECEATNTNSEGTQFTAASDTSLTVLSTNVTVFLTTTTPILQNDLVVYLHFTLPAEFITPVTVNARYEAMEGSFDRIYPNMFSNTMEVDFRIPDLPPIDNFTTRITFSSAGVTTDPIPAERIDIRVPDTGGVQPPNNENDSDLIVAVTVGTGAIAVAIIVLVIVIVCVAVLYCKQLRIAPDSSSLAAGGAPPPPSYKEIQEVISLPWQALFGAKDDPWQASWHLSARRITTVIKESETRTELEEVTFEAYVAVDVPWQAIQQESEALDLPVYWQARPREYILLLYHYRYYTEQIVETDAGEHGTIEDETYDAVTTTQRGTEYQTQQVEMTSYAAVTTTQRGTEYQTQQVVEMTSYDAVITTQRGIIEDKCQLEYASALNSQEDHPQQERQTTEEVKIDLGNY